MLRVDYHMFRATFIRVPASEIACDETPRGKKKVNFHSKATGSEILIAILCGNATHIFHLDFVSSGN